VLCLEAEQLALCYYYREQLFGLVLQLDNVGITDKGVAVIKAIRASIIVGVFECINWVDMLVRNVVLRGILLELSAAAANHFKLPAAGVLTMGAVGEALDDETFK